MIFTLRVLFPLHTGRHGYDSPESIGSRTYETTLELPDIPPEHFDVELTADGLTWKAGTVGRPTWSVAESRYRIDAVGPCDGTAASIELSRRVRSFLDSDNCWVLVEKHDYPPT